MCEKGRVDKGFRFYKEMRERELVPKGSTFMILICSLAMEGRNKEAIGVVFDMVGDSMSPNLLTYKTVVEGLCREGGVDDAFDVLEEFRMKDSFMNEKTYKSLLNGLHYARQMTDELRDFLETSLPKVIVDCSLVVKFNVNRVDNMVIHAIFLLDTLDKDVNSFSMRVRECELAEDKKGKGLNRILGDDRSRFSHAQAYKILAKCPFFNLQILGAEEGALQMVEIVKQGSV
ncbi:pentatricopeptide repeat-containing protein [Tanacetum coccineum]